MFKTNFDDNTSLSAFSKQTQMKFAWAAGTTVHTCYIRDAVLHLSKHI